MTSAKEQQDVSNQTSEICKFYREKTLFLTGAAGFLGVILLETLLRCCPDIRRIYILLRPKKGVQPEQRKEEIFRREIFESLRTKDPDTLKKVFVVTGDVSQENLGLSEADLLKVTREVSMVFHCAAAISFFKPLKFMMEQNVIGTDNIIELCKKMKNFEILAYTSTAFSNCTWKTIEEKIYDLPFSLEKVMNLARHGTEEQLLELFNMYKPSFPNYYTFSKCVCESLLRSKFDEVPSCIVRPSIILCSYKGILPGYIESGTGLVSLCVGIGKGFIRVLRVNPDLKCEMIPVDVVANAHIIAAFHQVTERLPSLQVYNCTTDNKNAFTWNALIKTLFESTQKYPLPKTFQKPGLTICTNPVKYWLVSSIEHYLPASVIDLLMWITGRKLRLLKLYKFFEKSMKTLSYFTLNEWDIRVENFLAISEKLNPIDKELFPVVLDYNVEGLAKRLVSGAPQYRSKDDKPYEQRVRLSYMRYYFTSLIKWSVLGGIASIFYVLVF